MKQTSAYLPHGQPVAEFRASRIGNQLLGICLFLFLGCITVFGYQPPLQGDLIGFGISLLVTLGLLAAIVVGHRRMVYRVVFYHEGMHIQSG